MELIIRDIKREMQIGENIVTADKIVGTYCEGDMLTIRLPKQSVQTATVPQSAGAPVATAQSSLTIGHTYLINVRQYMTRPATSEFNFHDQWNNGIPMPLRIMKFTVIKETRGMVYGEACGVPLKTNTCIRCGRKLTHPVSQLYGIGPECGGHAHINPFETEQELYAALDYVKAQLAAITWTGWVIKSAVLEFKEVAER